jgi:hypothetical protein
VAAIAFESDPKRIAKVIGECARESLSVERMETEDVRTADWGHSDNCEANP